MGKKILIFNDGTGQTSSNRNVSNVWRLYSALPGHIHPHREADSYKVGPAGNMVAFYIRGIGSEDTRYVEEKGELNLWEVLKAFIAKWLGRGEEIISGKTIVERVHRSYRLFQEVYQAGDEIILVGFSRGAASVRILASELIKRHGVRISYMLLFDTVYSVLGEIKILDNPPMKRFTDFDIHRDVLQCDHLIAGDEMREKFPFSPVNSRIGVRQILFAGSHSDVGGGHEERGLSDITLEFAISELGRQGIKFEPSRIKELAIRPNPKALTTFVIIGGLGQRHFPRPLHDTQFLVHRSVIERSQVKGAVSIALSQLSAFSSESDAVLVSPHEIKSSFQYAGAAGSSAGT